MSAVISSNFVPGLERGVVPRWWASIVLSGCPVGFGSHLLYRFSLPPVVDNAGAPLAPVCELAAGREHPSDASSCRRREV